MESGEDVNGTSNTSDDNGTKVSYDCDGGVFDIFLQKSTPGEDFQGLDMITSLMSVPRVKRKSQYTGTLIGEVSSDNGDKDEEEEDDDDDVLEWNLEQVSPSRNPVIGLNVGNNINGNDDVHNTSEIITRDVVEEEEPTLTGNYKYGFNNMKGDVFNRLDEDVILSIDLRDPDRKSLSKRRKERIADENEKFDEDYYLSCLFEGEEELKRLLDFKPWWFEEEPIDFSEEDIFDLKNLSNRHYLLEKEEKKRLLLGLVDILFGYAYDIRINEGEDCTESHWNICKLSATLSWLETFTSPREVVCSCLQRSLIFPLVRNFTLGQQVMRDVTRLLRGSANKSVEQRWHGGKKSVVKSLLQIRRILNNSPDSRYILSDLYVNDYIIWSQKVKEKALLDLADTIERTLEKVTKSDLSLDLDLLESAAFQVLKEEEEKLMEYQQPTEDSRIQPEITASSTSALTNKMTSLTCSDGIGNSSTLTQSGLCSKE